MRTSHISTNVPIGKVQETSARITAPFLIVVRVWTTSYYFEVLLLLMRRSAQHVNRPVSMFTPSHTSTKQSHVKRRTMLWCSCGGRCSERLSCSGWNPRSDIGSIAGHSSAFCGVHVLRVFCGRARSAKKHPLPAIREVQPGYVITR